MVFLNSTFGNVTVWVADGQATQELDYGTRLVGQFADKGVQVERKELPDTHGYEPLSPGLHILSGGMTSVNDASTWMPAAKTLVTRMIEKAEEGELQLFGVCLGSQIIADCLAPGAIISGPVINAGLVEVEWSDGEGLAADALRVIPAFHYEQIDLSIAQRAGIEVVAAGPNAPVVAYRYGTQIAGMQLHPEFTASDTLELLNYNQDIIAQYGSNPSQDRQRSEGLAEALSPVLFHLVLRHLLKYSSC